MKVDSENLFLQNKCPQLSQQYNISYSIISMILEFVSKAEKLVPQLWKNETEASKRFTEIWFLKFILGVQAWSKMNKFEMRADFFKVTLLFDFSSTRNYLPLLMHALLSFHSALYGFMDCWTQTHIWKWLDRLYGKMLVTLLRIIKLTNLRNRNMETRKLHNN